MTNVQQQNNTRPANGRFYTLADCVLPPNGTRIVVHGAVVYRGREYHSPELVRFEAQEVMVFEFEPDIIGICMGSELVCIAVCAVNGSHITKEPLQGVTA